MLILWVFLHNNGGVPPIAGWFISWTIHLKWKSSNFGVPLFQENPILIYRPVSQITRLLNTVVFPLRIHQLWPKHHITHFDCSCCCSLLLFPAQPEALENVSRISCARGVCCSARDDEAKTYGDLFDGDQRKRVDWSNTNGGFCSGCNGHSMVMEWWLYQEL